MKRLHIAISIRDLEKSITDYTKRMGEKPVLVIENEYALWRTATVNLSIRNDSKSPPGTVRHLGWEDSEAKDFSSETDINGILWENFNAKQQAEEILEVWPNADVSYLSD
ncbi:MAG: hypothetical protein AAF518_19975 [Spirochaetota bacterium]